MKIGIERQKIILSYPFSINIHLIDAQTSNSNRSTANLGQRKYSSKHSEAIITEDNVVAERFSKEVDAACVYCNVSTAFTDGGQFGFGAEIGISTQKLHARGPMALNEITSYKYIIKGDGQTRVDGAPQKCCI